MRPDYAPGLNRLALAYGRLGLHNEAVATIQRAIEIQPNDAAHPATLGELQLNQGLILAAEESFLEALALDDGLPDARRGLAEVARRRGLYDVALGQIDLALTDPRMDARSARCWRSTANASSASGCCWPSCSSGSNPARRHRSTTARWPRSTPAGGCGTRPWSCSGAPETTRSSRNAWPTCCSRPAATARRTRSTPAWPPTSEAARREINDGVTLALLGDDEAAVAAYRAGAGDRAGPPAGPALPGQRAAAAGRRGEEAVEAVQGIPRPRLPGRGLPSGCGGSCCRSLPRCCPRTTSPAGAPAADPGTRANRKPKEGPDRERAGSHAIAALLALAVGLLLFVTLLAGPGRPATPEGFSIAITEPANQEVVFGKTKIAADGQDRRSGRWWTASSSSSAMM